MGLVHLFRTPILSGTEKDAFLGALGEMSLDVSRVETEYCFNIGVAAPLDEGEVEVLRWLISDN